MWSWSVLSPLLFIIVLVALYKKFRKGLPYELLYADDLVLVAESEELLVSREDREVEERTWDWGAKRKFWKDEDNEMRDWCRTSKELRQISVWFFFVWRESVEIQYYAQCAKNGFTKNVAILRGDWSLIHFTCARLCRCKSTGEKCRG